jgi:hypothetical protein
MDDDNLAVEGEDQPGEPLIEPVMRNGRRLRSSPSLAETRGRAARDPRPPPCMAMEGRGADALRLVEPQYLSSLFERLTERLLVVTRRAFDESLPSVIEALRDVPVLTLARGLHETDSVALPSRQQREDEFS